MAVQTKITGTLTTPQGTALTSGTLIISLSESFTSIDGFFIAPFSISINVTNPLDFYLTATRNTVESSIYTQIDPACAVYIIEYDPDGSVTPMNMKSGYFKNKVYVPHISDTPEDNYINISDLLPYEYSNIVQGYGNINILDNNDGILSGDQKDTLTSGLYNAGLLHTHIGIGDSFILLTKVSDPGEVLENRAKLYFGSNVVGSRSAVALKLENQEIITMDYV